MIKDLQRKFILINMLLVFCVLAAVFSIFTASSYSKAKEKSEKELYMALNRKEGMYPPLFEVGKKPPQDFVRSAVFVVKIDENKNVSLVHADNISISMSDLNLIGEQILSYNDNKGIIKEYNLRFMTVTEGNLTKAALIEISEEQSVLKSTVMLSLALMAVTMGAFFAISIFLSAWALKPAENAWEQQKRFISDASHELKTPLTVILANTDILEAKQSDSIKNQIKWLHNTREEALRMKQLVNNMLFLAKSDSNKITDIHSKVDLSDIVLNISLAFESVAFEKEIEINTSKISKDILILGSESKLKQLLSILMDNAVKYSLKNHAIVVELTKTNTKAELRISNHGASLSKDVLPHLFERFYRCDESRAAEGYGLGLSIAQTIVHGHKGKIYAQSTENINTFVVVFPAL